MNIKDLISILDLSVAEIEEIFMTARTCKEKQKKGEEYTPLKGKSLAMIFAKSSTRTRVSFEVGMLQLGGHALFMSTQDMQLKRGETIHDTAKTLSRYVDGIMMRTYSHKDVLEMAEHATIPVINGLTDLSHPCQALTDIFTIIEKKGKATGLKIVYLGDGDNVANSLAVIAGKLGLHMVICIPPGYEPDKGIIKEAQALAAESGAQIKLTNDPQTAATAADILYTDVWTSMGKEQEREERLKIFKPYQLNSRLLAKANPGYMVMHCLPAHRGEEITDEVMASQQNISFDQAENRLHVQKAILTLLLGK
ncbi:MAG: ornithine carbamoyltransferase [bacterium]|nr:ornithine carbamoyltransferase [bacterium]